jgi:hypothetical protein
MPIFKTEIERRLARKLRKTEFITKNSFNLIKEDINEVQKSVEVMKKYLKNQEKQHNYARKQDNKIRERFQKDVDEFTQKTKQLSLALARVKEIEKTLVTKPDLAKIEDKIKIAFKDQIDMFKDQEKEFKQHINDFNKRLHKAEKQNGNGKSKRRFWFSRKNKEE